MVDAETLGGAEMHSKVSGVSDFLAQVRARNFLFNQQDEHHGIFLARQIVSNLNYSKKTPLPATTLGFVEEPYYNPDEILGIVGADIRQPFDSREVCRDSRAQTGILSCCR